MTAPYRRAFSIARWRKKLPRWRRLLKPAQATDSRRLIVASGLFDPEWYLERYPDVAAAHLDPLDHYLNHGGVEGRKAGPAFDGRWYMERYPDVVGSGLHPLVHYLVHGQGRDAVKPVSVTGEQASPQELEDAARLLASPLFDAAWYERQNELQTSGRVTALHYLKIGAHSGAAPSPHFDGQAYLREYPDVAEAGANPLLHFIRHGSGEGRRTFPLRNARAGAGFDRFARQPIETPGSPPAFEWCAAVELRPEQGRRAIVRLGGSPAGLATIVYDDATEPLPAELRSAISLFCTLQDIAPQSFVVAQGERGELRMPDHGDIPDGLTLKPGDGWFVNDHLLRLRFEADAEVRTVVRFLQMDEGGLARIVGEAPLAGDELQLFDVRLLDVFAPILVIYSDPHGRLRGGSLIPFPSLFRGGVHGGEVEAAEGETTTAKRERLSALLMRDAVGWAGAPDFSLGRIHVDLEGASGAERLFSPPVLAWLGRLGVQVSPLKRNTAAHEATTRHLQTGLARFKPERPRSAKGALTLPGDALPTLGVLLGRRPLPSSPRTGSYVVCDAGHPTPRWLVSLPSIGADLLDVQPAESPRPFPVLSGGDDDAARIAHPGPLTIRYRDPAPLRVPSQLYPVAPDARQPILSKTLAPSRKSRAEITTLIVVENMESATALVESLARQSLCAGIRLEIAAPKELHAALHTLGDRLFPSRVRIVSHAEGCPASTLIALVDQASPTDMLLVAHEDVVLHDARTIETLYLMASQPAVASASCVRVRDGGFQAGGHVNVVGGGLFPTRFDIQGAPSIRFEPLKTTAPFPLATFPVPANDLVLTMIPASAWKALGGMDAMRYPFDGFALDFAARGLKAGMIHLCTSAIAVMERATGDSHQNEISATLDTHDLSLWAEALERTTILRALH